MKKVILCITVFAFLAGPALELQARGRGGGGRGGGGRGGGNFSRGGGGRPNVSRPSPRPSTPSFNRPSSRPATPTFSRPSPSRPSTRPSMPSRPSSPPSFNRPSTPTQRPSTRPSPRPSVPGTSRPSIPGTSRPSVPGTIRPSVPGTGDRPSIQPGNRPSTLPGEGNRPSIRPDQRPGTRPGTRPGQGERPTVKPGDRPSTLPGTRPSPGDRPNIKPGDRPGGGDRPTTLPGTRPGIGDRPGRPGEGNRPGGGDRPTTLPGLGLDRPDRPGGGNRPTRPGLGDRWERPSQLPDRPDRGDRITNINNRFNNINNININNRNNYWNDYRDRWSNRWNDRHWYHHHWHHGFWPVYRPGYWAGYWWDRYPVLTAFGVTTWAVNRVGWATGYYNYYNPYATPYVIDQSSVYYNYSQPIQVVETYPQQAADTGTAAPPDVSDETISTFDRAMQEFYGGDYETALKSVNEALQELPNDAAVHEFRALVLFALGRYEESAATLYAVLSVGPGWDWTTMSSLYPSVEVYTKQLRALEKYRNEHPDESAPRFVLAYHYITQGHEDEGAEQLKKVVQLNPKDELSRNMLLSIDPDADVAKPEITEPPKPSAQIEQAQLVGTWTAERGGEQFVMDLKDDGDFTWTYTPSNGEASTVSGVWAVDDESIIALDMGEDDTMLAQLNLVGGELNFYMLGDSRGAEPLKFTK